MTPNNETTVELPRGEAFETQTDNEAVEHLTNVTSIEPVPLNGGYAWVCTLCVFLVNSHTWGINSSWAVIMAHYSNESTDLKTSHFEYAIIGGLSISQVLLCSPVATQCHKHLGMRATMLIGSFIIFVSLLSSSFVTKVWQLVLAQGMCFGWGMGFLYIPASSSCPLGIGGLIYSLVTKTAIDRFGVHWTYRILAVCALIANVVASLFLRETGGKARRVARRDELRFNPRDFGRVEVLLVMIWGIATELGYIVLLYSLPSYAASVGMTPTQGSVANALLNLGLGLGRPLVSYFSDTVGRIQHGHAHDGPVVGMKKMAGTFGVVCLSMVLPTTFAEVAAIEMSVGSDGKDFTSAQVFVAFMFVAGALSVWMLRSWKIFDSETERPVAPAPRSRYGVSWLAPRFLFRLWHV
ncbi:major facilitator superfamily domain-containing protein [Verticillium dahliae]|nr:major facilitator superfamily domain-containing protein [Verticillium dahliae]